MPLQSLARTGFIGSNQLGFGDYEQATAKKCTRRERFLAEMEKVVPWNAARWLHRAAALPLAHLVPLCQES
jgi:hypothetical protein